MVQREWVTYPGALSRCAVWLGWPAASPGPQPYPRPAVRRPTGISPSQASRHCSSFCLHPPECQQKRGMSNRGSSEQNSRVPPSLFHVSVTEQLSLALLGSLQVPELVPAEYKKAQGPLCTRAADSHRAGTSEGITLRGELQSRGRGLQIGSGSSRLHLMDCYLEINTCVPI